MCHIQYIRLYSYIIEEKQCHDGSTGDPINLRQACSVLSIRHQQPTKEVSKIQSLPAASSSCVAAVSNPIQLTG